MRTITRTLALLSLAVLILATVNACNHNPVDQQSSSGNKPDHSGLKSARDKGKKVMNLEATLSAGEKWKISVSDFDQLGLDAFVSVTVDATDPRVPVFGNSGECAAIEIIIDGVDPSVIGKCGAQNFESQEITLVNNSESLLSVSAVVTGISKYLTPDDRK